MLWVQYVANLSGLDRQEDAVLDISDECRLPSSEFRNDRGSHSYSGLGNPRENFWHL